MSVAAAGICARLWDETVLAILFVMFARVAGSYTYRPEGEEGTKWVIVKQESVILEAHKCVAIDFHVGGESPGRLSVFPVNFPEECSPDSDLWLTPNWYYLGGCLGTNPNKFYCRYADGREIQSKEELCHYWGQLTKTDFFNNLDLPDRFTVTGSPIFPLKDKHYFMGMKSTCGSPVEVIIKVETKPRSELKRFWLCTTVLTVAVFLLGGTLVMGTFALCCYFCPCCPIFRRVREGRQREEGRKEASNRIPAFIISVADV